MTFTSIFFPSILSVIGLIRRDSFDSILFINMHCLIFIQLEFPVKYNISNYVDVISYYSGVLNTAPGTTQCVNTRDTPRIKISWWTTNHTHH